VGAKLLFPDGKIQHAGVVLCDRSMYGEPDFPTHIFFQLPADHPPANLRRVYQVLTGACLLVKRAAFEAVGGFCEEYWNGYEDVDLCLSLSARGWRCVYEPESSLTHFESQSGPERFSRVDQNVAILARRWQGKVECDFRFTPAGRLEPKSASGFYTFLGADSVSFEDTLQSLRSNPPEPWALPVMLERPPLRHRQPRSPRTLAYNVLVVDPPGYSHFGVFNEVADLLVHSLRSLGHVAHWQRNLADPAAMNIILGYNLLPNPHDIQNIPHTIFQLEQLSVREGWFRPELMEVLKYADQVWDYAPENIAFLAERGLSNAQLLPIGFHDTMRRIGRQTQDIDVLFYGCLNERRKALLEEVGRFANVKCLISVYGQERDAYIARSKIVVNLHYYEAQIMEQVRLSYLLNNHAFVISESSPRDVYEGAVVTADYADLAATIRHYLDRPQERHQKAKEGFQFLKARPMTEYLRAILPTAQGERRATG
jgi:hypothetical protein